VRIADDIFQMPLHSVYPALQIEPVLYRVIVVRIADGRVDVVLDVIIAMALLKISLQSCVKDIDYVLILK
jgi:hypothetical protein